MWVFRSVPAHGACAFDGLARCQSSEVRFGSCNAHRPIVNQCSLHSAADCYESIFISNSVNDSF